MKHLTLHLSLITCDATVALKCLGVLHTNCPPTSLDDHLAQLLM